MALIYTIFAAVLLCCSSTRCFIFNIHNVVFYSVYDTYRYFRDEKWKDFRYFGIDMFIGMFGHGKTLSMTHKARKLYKKYGDSIRFVSNYKLLGIPYIPLINFNQLLELGEEEESPYKGTVVLIDEIENVLNNRNFSSFPLQLLHTLTQQRKKHVYIMCSAQRFFMVDKLFRSITTHGIDCDKYWRFQRACYYDAWDYENAVNTQLVKPLLNVWWFVHDRDYNSYDTEQMISRNMAEQFISNEEAIVRKGLDATAVSENAIKKPSRRLVRLRKKK